MTKQKQTKIGTVQAMLKRPSGASLDAICTTTGWQPHSARAALSGLRKAGFTIDREAARKEGGDPVYRITAGPEDAA